MADQKVKVRIEADARQASQEIQKTQTGFQRLGSFVKRNLRTAFITATAAIAGFTAALAAAVKASAVQEEAVARLNTALRPLGDAAGEVSEQLQKQAAALQNLSKFGDEAIINAQALLATMGVTAAKLPLATTAVVDMAEAFGFTLEQAARNVGRTMGGFAGELGELIPELKELSPEALRAGAGIDLLAEKFKGTAEATDSFAKTVAQFRNAFSDLLEAIGEGITGNKELSATLDELKKGFSDNREAIGRTAADILKLVTGSLELWISAMKRLGDAYTFVTEKMENWSGQIDAVQPSSEALAATAARLGISVAELQRQMDAAAERTRQFNAAMNQAGNAADGTKGQVDDLTRSVADLSNAYSEAIDATSALGTVTSLQLEAQMIEMGIQLAQQKVLLGENSAEWQRMAADAGAAMATLRERIDSLKAGFGDLNTETTSVSDDFEEIGRSAQRGAAGMNQLTTAVNANTGAWRANATASQGGAQFGRIGTRLAFQGYGGPGIGRYTGLPVGRGTGGTFTTVRPSGRLALV
jgi:chromosome segregation ATPase